MQDIATIAFQNACATAIAQAKRLGTHVFVFRNGDGVLDLTPSKEVAGDFYLFEARPDHIGNFS